MADEDLLSVYFSESNDQLASLEIDILALAQKKTPELINSIFRVIHTLKGGSMMMGFENIGNLAHSMESLFGEIRSGNISITDEMIDFSLNVIDRLKQMVQSPEKEPSFDNKKYIQQIQKYLYSEDTDSFTNSLDLVSEDDKFEFFSIMSISKDEVEPYVVDARSSKRFLSFILLDLSDQIYDTLGDFNNVLRKLESMILKQSILSQKINPIHVKDYYLPFGIILLSDEDPEEILANHTLKPELIHIIHQPERNFRENYAQKQEEVQTSENEKNNDIQLKVDLPIIDDLIKLASEAVIVRNQIMQSVEWDEDSEQGIRMTRLSQIITSFQTRIMKTRLQKLQSIYPRISRAVRDISGKLSKSVNFTFDGGDVELDRLVVDAILESLIHIIRNSIDHGIEEKEERVKKGKNPVGNIYLSASLRSGNVQIQIRDDGRGLNYDAIKNLAIDRGLITKDQANSMKDEEARRIILLPGFSTKKEVNQFSGRGVGMDVVEKSFKRLGGKIHIESEFNKGIVITATIPQTVTVVFAVIILIDGKKYAIFQKHVLEIFYVNSTSLVDINGSKIYKLRDQLIPVVDTYKSLYPKREKINPAEHMAVIQIENYTIGLLFDQMVGIEEIVIKPLGEHFNDLEIFSGATVLGDGSAILILDPLGIIHSMNLKLDTINTELDKVNLDSTKKLGSNYIVFTSGENTFIADSVDVLRVESIGELNLKHMSGKDYVIYENQMIHAFHIQKYFQSKENYITPKNIIILSLDDGFYGILIDSILDIISEFNILSSGNKNQKEYVLGHTIFDGRLAIFLNLPDFISTLLREEI
ncbi:MAG: chemotaxis protein CheA [Leptospiraceae bacterium]|nr:chemotaxis protein CheA [Leptospiraceae bacterium]